MPDRKTSIIDNPTLSRKIVYAVNKAISEDLPRAIRENHLETNNRNRYAAGDYINDNLRHHVVKDDVELIPFKRYAWDGRIIIDRGNKITYTIATSQNLKAIINKDRTRPHYLQSILYAENSDCVCKERQMSLNDIVPGFVVSTFEPETLEIDYYNIMDGKVSAADRYKHYVIVYTAENHSITKIEAQLLDNDFHIVDRKDLIEYLKPDFANMTENTYFEQTKEESSQEGGKSVKLKLRPEIKQQEK